MGNPRKDFWPLIFDLRPLFLGIRFSVLGIRFLYGLRRNALASERAYACLPLRPSCPLWFKYPVFNHPLPQVVPTFSLLCVFFASFAVNSFAQDTTAPTFPQQPDLDSYRLKIATGSTEDKREALYQLRNINTPEASRIAVLALRDANEIVRVTATHSVLALPSDEAFTALLPLIKDKFPYVREEAAYALGKTKNPGAVEPLILLIRKEKKMEVRGACAFALGLLGDVRAEDSLIWAMTKKSNLFVQRAAVRSLGQVKSRKAVPLLIDFLRDPKRHDDVKREAARALGEIGDPEATKILEENLKSPDYYLAEICKKSLEKILATK